MLYVSYHVGHRWIAAGAGGGDCVIDSENAPRSKNDLERVKERIRKEFVREHPHLIEAGGGYLDGDIPLVHIYFWAELD